jgi:hypothetical protein
MIFWVTGLAISKLVSLKEPLSDGPSFFSSDSALWHTRHI